MSDDRRSPLKDPPLRNPGQSVEDARRRSREESLDPALIAALVLLIMAGLEWWRYAADAPPQPVAFSVVASAAVAYAAWRFFTERTRSRALRQAADGEKAVGQYLEGLRKDGYQVFHDVLGPGFNVDHVLIGPAGVFTVETKTWSKPARGAARVQFDGERLTVAGREPERDPLVQIRAQATWVRELLADSTGRKFDVRPTLLFPGWFVEQSGQSTREVWVLNPKALPDFLAHAPRRLPPEDVKLASFHLSRYIRASATDET